ncbi:MAG: hypothetical protein R2860_10460 [Desulfobacterales bacterium]
MGAYTGYSGFNDSMAFHKQASDFLAQLPGNISRVDLLPFHNWCEINTHDAGMDWSMENRNNGPSFLEDSG